jgi:amino acid transporter
MAITLALAVTLIGHAGSAQNLATFTPATSPTGLYPGVAYGMIFGILSYTGFESIIPLAEETKSPRRLISRAVVISVVVMVVYYAIYGYATVVGWPGGVGDMSKGFASNPNPYLLIANKVWGGASILVILALVNSGWGCSLAGQNAVVRVLYSMGRHGVFPKGLGMIHPSHRSPVGAIALTTVINYVVTLGLGFWLGPTGEFGFLGVVITVGLIFVYGVGMISVPVYYRREHPEQLNVWLHWVIPIVGTLLLIPPLYASLVPVPAFPFNLPPYVDIVWMLIGVIVLVYLSRTRPEAIATAGKIVFEETPEEVTSS